MAAAKDLPAVTLQLEVKNGVDKMTSPNSRTSAMTTWTPRPQRTSWRKWAKNSAG